MPRTRVDDVEDGLVETSFVILVGGKGLVDGFEVGTWFCCRYETDSEADDEPGIRPVG